MRGLLILILISFYGCTSFSQPKEVLAFPGADGFGRFTTGGRGGKVFIVTNLNDAGPGSFREAVKKKEKRTIVFAVSGTIAMESDIDISYGDLTIAGQSAPGDGICLKNFQVKINADNVIIRYMRFRLGDERKQQGDAIMAIGHKDIIIDHCSMSWATDECASFYHNRNFTLQWSIISESLNHSVHEKGDHGYGGIWGGEGATFHHNLISSHNSRLPRFAGSSTTRNTPDELVDFRNNVVYNWMQNNSYGGELGRYNMIANYYKPGPASAKKNRIVNPSSPIGKFYLSGNFVSGSPDVTNDNRKGVHCNNIDSAWVTTPFSTEYSSKEDAQSAFASVLAGAGASLSRDAVDARVVSEARTGTAAYGVNAKGIIDSQRDVGGWPELKTAAEQPDADKDGMPDAWEAMKKLDAKVPGDHSAYTLDKSYTNLEVYLNELVNKSSTNK